MRANESATIKATVVARRVSWPRSKPLASIVETRGIAIEALDVEIEAAGFDRETTQAAIEAAYIDRADGECSRGNG